MNKAISIALTLMTETLFTEDGYVVKSKVKIYSPFGNFAERAK